jgi:hypothetical protein
MQNKNSVMCAGSGLDPVDFKDNKDPRHSTVNSSYKFCAGSGLDPVDVQTKYAGPVNFFFYVVPKDQQKEQMPEPTKNVQIRSNL